MATPASQSSGFIPGNQSEKPPLEVGMLLYPHLTALDLVGPQCAFGPHARTYLFWKTLKPVPTDTGFSILPTATLSEGPRELDVLFVPGGMGTGAWMEDAEVLTFLAERGRSARYVTSVCTGSLLLGMAGLLDGYKAATHWAFYEALAALGIEGIRERVVVDRNRVTGGGVTAGVDFGLTLLAALRGEPTARATQLMMEYDPKPPFDAGSPASAGPDTTAVVSGIVGDTLQEMLRLARARRSSAPVAA